MDSAIRSVVFSGFIWEWWPRWVRLVSGALLFQPDLVVSYGVKRLVIGRLGVQVPSSALNECVVSVDV